MVGFDQFFAIHSTKEDAIKSCIALEAMRRAEKDWHRLPTYQKNSARFTVFEASQKEAVLKVVGDISKVLYAQLEEEDIFSRRFSETEYSIGLGALGESVKDCIHILGEMITIGGTMVWLPTDGNDTSLTIRQLVVPLSVSRIFRTLYLNEARDRYRWGM